MRVIYCDICNKPINDADDDMVRVLTGMDEDGIAEYFVFGFEDEEGEPNDRHMCLDCLKGFLESLNPVDLQKLATAADDAQDDPEDDSKGGTTTKEPPKNNKKKG